MIAFACAHCGQKLQVPPTFAGKPVRCSLCKHVMTCPAPVAVAVEGTVALPRMEGQPSSLAQAGLSGGVTLAFSDSASNDPTVKDNADRRSLRQVLASGPSGGERYQVLGEIARGGMGAVLRAADCDIRREVAVKYLLDQSDPRKKDRFVEEAQITGQLEHPNIVPIHELGVDAHKRLFFSMKMVRGRSLHQVMSELREYPRTAEKEYSLVRLLNVFISVCHALAYAHSRGVVHRDLKPANIMVGDFGEVYVMDWGLAKVMERDASTKKSSGVIDTLPSFAWAETNNGDSATDGVKTSRATSGDQTIEGTVLGTPLYMPPEQARGDLVAIDARSDVYSLGALLYEMLTLQPPVEKGGGHLSILLRVSQGEIVPPQQRDPKRMRAGKIPGELAAIAMKALAKKPTNRYESVEALRRDIERYLEGRSVSAKEDTKWEVLRKLALRNKGFTAAASAAAALLLLVMIASTWINYKARVRAENAYAAYLQEQVDKRAQVRKSVPAFVAAAHLAADQKQLDDALAQINVALEYDPDHAAARLFKGQLLVARRDFANAAKELEQYLKTRPNDLETAKLARLCAGNKPDDPAALLEVVDVLVRQHLPTLAEGLVAAPEKMLEIHRQKIEAAWPGMGKFLSMDGNGNLNLQLANSPQVLDLTPLKGMPFRSLVLHHLKIRDLAPLKGMPLTSLNLNNCTHVSDLTPLRGMKLTSLDVLGCGPIADFSMLRGMPLTRLAVQGTFRDKDVRMLRDMPLTDLTLNYPEITTLEPLKGKKLTTVALGWCNGFDDLSPLRDMPLTSLSLTSCGSVEDISPLKGMPLTVLNLQQSSRIRDLSVLSGMRLTNLNVASCTEIKDLKPLKGMPLVSLQLNGCGQIKDLTPLRGLPLTQLDLGACEQITDWTPLRGMPLISLGLASCGQIEDLSFVQGMPLTQLTLDGCRQIKDVSPLRGMPLVSLRLHACVQVTDLTPLEGMKLTYLHFPPKSVKKGVDVIRRMKTLATINDFTVGEFWKRYDTGEFAK